MDLRSMSGLLIGIAWLIVAVVPASAQTSTQTAAASQNALSVRPLTSGPSWSKLTAQQRSALAPLERDWAKIDAPGKTKWLEVAGRFPAMPAADQQRVQERMTEWARMTPSERGRARLSFQESKQFSPEQKQAHWEAYQALPDDERRALADRNRPDAGDKPGSALPTKTSNIARSSASAPNTKPVAPTMVQAKPGATTNLMTVTADPPAHHRPGQPKIAAEPGLVDPSTLLPQSGPQAAASASSRP